MMPCQTNVLPFLRFSEYVDPFTWARHQDLGMNWASPSRNHAAALAHPTHEQGKWEKLKNPQRRRKNVNQTTTK